MATQGGMPIIFVSAGEGRLEQSQGCDYLAQGWLRAPDQSGRAASLTVVVRGGLRAILLSPGLASSRYAGGAPPFFVVRLASDWQWVWRRPADATDALTL